MLFPGIGGTASSVALVTDGVSIRRLVMCLVSCFGFIDNDVFECVPD